MWRTFAGSAALALTLVQADGLVAAESQGRTAPARAKPTRPANGSRAVVLAADPPLAPEPAGAAAPMFDEAIDQTGPTTLEPAAPQILNRNEMISLARKYSAEIAEALVEGERHREVAIREKDAIKLACIQDRLSNIKTMKRLSDERLAATERKAIRDDELNLRHEFRGVEMAYQRVVELRRELVECVGESLTIDGPTGTTPIGADPAGSNAQIPPPERPVPASNYR